MAFLPLALAYLLGFVTALIVRSAHQASRIADAHADSYDAGYRAAMDDLTERNKSRARKAAATRRNAT